MTITLNIEEFSFADLAVKLLPLLKTDSTETAVGKLTEAVTQLPEEVVRSVFAAIPADSQKEIVSLLASEQRERLLSAADSALGQNGIDITLDHLCLSRDLTLEVGVSAINYTALAVRFFPQLGRIETSQESPAAALLQHLCNLPGFLLRAAVDALPQEKKDDLVIYLVTRFKSKILDKLEELAETNGIRLELDDLVISK